MEVLLKNISYSKAQAHIKKGYQLKVFYFSEVPIVMDSSTVLTLIESAPRIETALQGAYVKMNIWHCYSMYHHI